MSGPSLIGDHVEELTRQIDQLRHRCGVQTRNLTAGNRLIEELQARLEVQAGALDRKNHLIEAREREISRLKRRIAELEQDNARTQHALDGMAGLFGCTPEPNGGGTHGPNL